MKLGAILGHLGDVVANGWVLLLQVWRVGPLRHFAEHEALAILDGILAIESSEHLHWPGVGGVVEVEHLERARQRLRWLDEIPVVDLWEHRHEIEDVGDVLVEVLNVSEALEGVHGVALVVPGAQLIVLADDDVQSDLGVVVDDLLAPLNGRSQVGVPDSAAVHADNAVRPDLVREQGWQGGRGNNGLHRVTNSLVENGVGASDNIHARDGNSSVNLVGELSEDGLQEIDKWLVVEDAGLGEETGEDAERRPLFVDISVVDACPGVREELDQVDFVAWLEDGNGSGVDGTRADACDNVVGVVGFVFIVHDESVKGAGLKGTLGAASAKSKGFARFGSLCFRGRGHGDAQRERTH